MFCEQPHTLQHLLLFGPPGSGKTTSAAWLVERIWGNRKSLMCISMNAADERSLESIRQKVFPFLTVDWRTSDDLHAPRFLILDECETLTEAAQLSLQTMLNSDPRDLCVILICNSQSRIHPKLRQRLLKIRYDPPRIAHSTSNGSFSDMIRGDLRQSHRKWETDTRLWNYLHCHPSELRQLLSDETIDEYTILSELLLLSEYMDILDKDIIDLINLIIPLLTDAVYSPVDIKDYMIRLLLRCREKIEGLFPSVTR